MLNHIKKIYLPYTVIDVGLWYQGSLPSLPSGKIDYALKFPATIVAEDGSHATCLTDLRDVGRYVEKVITDDRTLNKYVFAYNEIWTQEQIHSHLEKLSGEKPKRDVVSLPSRYNHYISLTRTRFPPRTLKPRLQQLKSSTTRATSLSPSFLDLQALSISTVSGSGRITSLSEPSSWAISTPRIFILILSRSSMWTMWMRCFKARASPSMPIVGKGKVGYIQK